MPRLSRLPLHTLDVEDSGGDGSDSVLDDDDSDDESQLTMSSVSKM